MRKDLKWEFADSRIEESEIKNFGAKLGIEFPDEYIECVKINGGAIVSPSEFDVQGKERMFGCLYSFDKNSSENIYDAYDARKETLPEGVIPFANDPAGNLICFDYKNHEEDPIVVFWEHEDAWEKEALMESEGITAEEAEEVARENVFYVASTFTEFLNKLHD
ncbi:SMI1/KNR4 family protein [Bacillus sp. BP-3]|uniref:SMI1/KNR4 family protein n=1 Tax=Bacillus sp. BP-3 TaxID=3022773 RepID=UPI00232BC25F|nr:SMI1/KNR4 family protein [Bacillus sp. BP-3]MDC2866677.1 SMI1/KNR4 family protein [Bacillus sp. BP-3]